MTRKPRRRGTPFVLLAGVAAMALLLLPQIGAAQDDVDDHASPGEWLYLAILSVETTALIVVFSLFRHRQVNPHTGLPSKVKRRRARGRPKA
jgi:hypothetical protein